MISGTPGSPDVSPPHRLITVLCVDDNADLVSLLCARICNEKDMTALQGVTDVASFVKVANEIRPDIALVDLTMPGTLMPLAAIQSVSEAVPDVRILAFSAKDDPATINEVMEAGAWGFVSKNADFSLVIQAIRRVAAGEVSF